MKSFFAVALVRVGIIRITRMQTLRTTKRISQNTRLGKQSVLSLKESVSFRDFTNIYDEHT